MNRDFIVNLLFLITLNLLVKSFYLFGIDRVVQNTVEAGPYGLYFAFFNLTYLFQIVNDFGIQHYNNRNIARHNQLLEKYFTNILVLKTGLGLLFLFLLVVAAVVLGYQLPQIPLLLWIGFNQVLVSFIFYLRSNISGLGYYRLDSFFSVMDKLFMILFCGGLLLVPASREAFKIEWFVWTQSLSFFLTAAIAFVWIRSRIKTLRIRIRPAMLLLIIKRSYPFSLIILFMAIYTRTDGVMIERLLEEGAYQAGLYASAFRLLDAANMLAILFPTLLLPMFSKMLARRAPIGELTHLGLKTIWAGAISGALAVYFYRTEIMMLLYDSGNAYSGQILGYLMLTFIAMSGTYIYGTLLLANNNTRALNMLFAGSVVVNIALNFILIPTHQALGAALATLITQTGVFVGECLLSYRLLPLKPDRDVFIRSTLLIGGILLIHLLVLPFFNGSWMFKFLLGLAGGLLLSFFLRLIDLPYWLKLIQEKPS